MKKGEQCFSSQNREMEEVVSSEDGQSVLRSSSRVSVDSGEMKKRKRITTPMRSQVSDWERMGV